ncbi:MAG TPA: serine/threonine-protein kinase [Pyrinomonadaceae bacterium]|jgi:non-specific serine/threonine protein kinase/serine/threonine-protein kinase
MNAERYQKIKEIFNQSVEIAVSEREDFLKKACDDSEMRREVEKMLFFSDDADDTLEKNVFEVFSGGMDAKIPTAIGDYKILREIGRGGMGAVYEAVRENRNFRQRVALKVIKRGMDSDAVVSRFRHEQKILASLEHPFIARFLDGGMTDEGLPFYAMEFVTGESIDDYCAAKNLSLDEKLGLFREVCAALQYAHQNLVIHRDLKPKNILVTTDGTPKLLDFGIGKILTPESEEAPGTATQLGMMTPAYASPEQIRGQRIGTASDIYSLGVILYELLTGQKPYKFNSKSQFEIEKAVLETEPPKPSAITNNNSRITNSKTTEANPKSKIQNPKSLRGDLDTIILKALRKEIAERYVSVGQFSEDIRRYLEGVPIFARPHTFSYRAAKFIKRHRAPVLAAALVFLALCAGMTLAVWQAFRAEQQRILAERRFSQVRTLANNVVFKYHDAIADLQGSTAVREMLVKDALQYLDALAVDAQSDNELKKELALAYLKLADVQGKAYAANIGDTQGALDSYRKAIALFEETAASAPDDIAAKDNLVKAYDSLALLMTRSGGAAAAAELLRKASVLNEELLKLEPENSARRVQMVELQIRAGDLASGLENSLREHLKALPLAEELVRSDSQNPGRMRSFVRVNQRLGTDYQRLGTIAETENRSEEARAFFAQSLVYQRKMYEATQKLYAIEGNNSANYRYLALAAINLGEALGKNGDPEGGLQMLAKAQVILEEIRRLDPKNNETKFDLLIVHESFGVIYRHQKENRKALEQYRKVVELDEEIYETDPQKLEVLNHLKAGYGILAEISGELGEDVKAAFYRQKAADSVELYAAKVKVANQK